MRVLLLAPVIVACARDPGPAPDWARDEAWRPQLHYTPAQGWLSDPNGLVWWNGEYHLFHQHNPDASTFGPMHWGHAASADLHHWTELPVALEPDPVLGDAFSGSAVVDESDASGLCGGEPCVVLVYTLAGGEDGRQKQGLAVSTDGRTFTPYEGNPVLEDPAEPDFRDPKVVRFEDEWVMALAVGDRVSFYASDDLIDWTWRSDFAIEAEGDVECPDLFELRAGSATRWVLTASVSQGGPQGGSGTRYWVGDFDGSVFEAGSEAWLDLGPDAYAFQTWSNEPHGRVIGVAWMSNWRYALTAPTEPWRGAMTLPRELWLTTDVDGAWRLAQAPADLGWATWRVRERDDAHAGLLEIRASVRTGDGGEVGFRLHDGATVVGWNDEEGLFVDRTGNLAFAEGFAGRHSTPYAGDEIDLHVIVDTSSVEVFAADGRIAMTALAFPPTAAPTLEAYVEGDVRVRDIDVWELQTAWEAP